MDNPTYRQGKLASYTLADFIELELRKHGKLRLELLKEILVKKGVLKDTPSAKANVYVAIKRSKGRFERVDFGVYQVKGRK